MFENEGFHWRDNIFWKRLEDGSVRIAFFATRASGNIVDGDDEEPTRELIIPAAEWASIVDAVSGKGEREAAASAPERTVDTTKLNAGQLVQLILRVLDHDVSTLTAAKLAEQIAAGILDLPADYWHRPAPVRPLVKEGWQLVPKAPTQEMLAAANEATLSTETLLDDTRYACERANWKAMLTAAPQPTATYEVRLEASDQMATKTCRKCGAIEQEREVMDRVYRWRKEGPPPGNGWVGPIFPNAQLQIYERPTRKRFFDCKFVCPNQTAAPQPNETAQHSGMANACEQDEGA